jgi:dTDP-glucose 4,6-dehydratase/UDP-glucuronate decarboxylase
MKDAHFLRDAGEVIAGLGPLNDRFAGKHILLTGAAGFLGVQFTHYFAALNDSGRLARPCRLVAADSFIRGRPAWIDALAGRPDLAVQQSDIVRQRDFEAFDFIIHAASVASPIFYRQHPIETMDANVIGLRNLLDHAVRHRPEGFLFFSTSEIYGDPDAAHIPTKESYRGNVSCTGPRACYDESKRYGETLCVNFHHVHQVPVVSVRPFNNYGPGLRISDRRVLPDFFRDALAGRDIVMLSDGRATRTFCYVADAIEGYLRAMLLGRHGEAYNIGTETPEISMTDLARLVIRVTGAQVQLVHRVSEDKDYTTDNPQRRCPDITKARSELKYSPRIVLEAGLQRAWEYYCDHADQ